MPSQFIAIIAHYTFAGGSDTVSPTTRIELPPPLRYRRYSHPECIHSPVRRAGCRAQLGDIEESANGDR